MTVTVRPRRLRTTDPLVPKRKGRAPSAFPPLTAAQQALVAQFRPMAHWVKVRKFRPLMETLGGEELSAWVDWFLCEAAQRFDPAKVSERTGKPVSFGAFMCPWVWGRLMLLANRTAADPLNVAMGEVTNADGESSRTAELHLDPDPLGAETVERADERRHHRRLCEALLAGLCARERFIVQARHGMFGGGRRWPYRKLGKVFDLSKERVRQIEAEAMERIGRVARKLADKGVTCG